eukprot:7799241-Alexandrium_andersonii.AAC.1
MLRSIVALVRVVVYTCRVRRSRRNIIEIRVRVEAEIQNPNKTSTQAHMVCERHELSWGCQHPRRNLSPS